MWAKYFLWTNILALVLATSGSLFLAMNWLPNLKTISAGFYTEIDETTSQIKRAKRLSTIGMWLLVAGFVLQAIVQIFEIILA